MVTSDILARCDAAVHVAHAFTVHAAQTEVDYLTAVDDLTPQEGKLGAGLISQTDLTSGLYYGYVVVDIPLLVSNLTGCDLRKDPESWKKADRTLAANVTESLVHLIATVSPGAKLGSTAPYSFAHLMLIEAGDAQPTTLANAFLDPVPTTGDLLANAYKALAYEIADLDLHYSRKLQRAHLARGEDARYNALMGSRREVEQGGERRTVGDLGPRLDLPQLATWAANCVKE